MRKLILEDGEDGEDGDGGGGGDMSTAAAGLIGPSSSVIMCTGPG